MEKEPIMRVMENKDLFDVPDAREEFEEHGRKGNYFFFVIEDEPYNVIGYLIAEKEEEKVIVKTLDLPDSFAEMQYFVNLVRKKLYDYVAAIKTCNGTPLAPKGVKFI